MFGKRTRGRRRMQMLHDLTVNSDYATLKQTAAQRMMWRHTVEQSCQHCKIGRRVIPPLPFPLPPLPFLPYPLSILFPPSLPSIPFISLLYPFPPLSLPLPLNPARRFGNAVSLKSGRQTHSVRFEFKIRNFRMSLSYTF